MDLLDSISAMITNTENHKSSGKPKKTNVAKSDTAVSLSKSVVSREQSLQNKKEPVLSKGRNDLITSMNLPVEMNALNIDLSNAPEYVSRYHIDIKKVMQKKKKDATRGPKQDVSTQLRRRALFSVFRQLVTERAEIFGEDSTKHVYDLGNTFYSIGCRIKEQDGDIVLDMKPDNIKCDFARDFFSKKCDRVVFTIQYTGEVFLKRLKQNESETSLREAARFLDVLTSQSLYHSDSHIFENKFFEGSTDNDIKLGEGKCIKSGFEKSIRVVEGGNDMPASLVLQVDTRKSPFHCAQSVLSFIQERTNCPNPEYALKEKIFQKKLIHDLRGLVVTTTHMNRNRRFFIYGIVENNARNQFFQTTEGSISVEQYFQEKYKLALRYPLLPLVTERQGSTGINFYPLEVLYIEPGQRVENKKLAGRLTEKVIQQTRMLPQEMRNHNIRQLVQANLMNEENQYLNSFGVRLSKKFMISEAKVLAAPQINYKSDSVRPNESGVLTWRLDQRLQFYRPATVEAISIVIFDRAIRDDQANSFYDVLTRAGRSRGMIVKNAGVIVNHLSSELESEIEDYFRRHAGKVSIIMFVTKDKKDIVHDFIKLLESKHKVVTQHVCKATVLSCIETRGGAKTLENVLLKFNVKCGGLNHIVTPSVTTLSNKTTQQDMNGRLFSGKMFVGFGLSHAAAQNLYDRQNEATVKEPTVVGLAYSTGFCTDYAGCWWYQQPRLHNILYIEDHFEKAFTTYYQTKQSLPTEVIIYRSGTSDSELPEVKDEANEIRAVAERMASLNGGKPYRPKITMIVVQSRSNYRIMPAPSIKPGYGRMNVHSANVPPGTCADTTVTDPRFREFIMISHQSPTGTCRPVRYIVVIEDSPQQPLYELELISHFLCHGHQQSTLPIHIPAVLYAAENLAKRGRAMWMTAVSENFEASSSCALKTSVDNEDSADIFYQRISRDLMNSLPNHYFA